MSEPAELLTIPEAAKRLRLGRSTLYRLFDLGEIPTVRLASRRFVAAKAIDDYIADNTVSM